MPTGRTFRFFVALCLAFSTLFAVSPAIAGGPGSLDPSWDSDGKAYAGSYVRRLGEVRGMALLPSGKVLVLSEAWVDLYDVDVVLVRFNSDGTLDTSYGDQGILTIVSDAYETSRGMVIQPDGKVVIAGWGETGGLVLRLDAGGALDTSFSEDGRVIVPDLFLESVALAPGGKIVAAGYVEDVDYVQHFVATRLTDSGALDTSFGGDGVATVQFAQWSEANGVAVDGDGRVYLAGTTRVLNPDFALARLDSSGTLDATFDSDGMATTDIDARPDFGLDLVLQSDGKVVVLGKARVATNVDFAVVRYNPDGSLDTSFDSDGKVTTHIGDNDEALTAAIDGSDRILVGGQARLETDQAPEFTLVRYMADGSLDASFGTGGIAHAMSGASGAEDVMVQPDGKILAAGTSWNGKSATIVVMRFLDSTIPETATTLTLEGTSAVRKGRRVVLSGTLGSTDAACTKSQQVTLVPLTFTASRMTTDTDDAGAFEFRFRLYHKTKFKVVYSGTGACNASESAEHRVRVLR